MTADEFRERLVRDVAAEVASLLGLEARHQVAGVVRTLEAENGSHAVVRGERHPLCCDCDHCLNGDHHA